MSDLQLGLVAIGAVVIAVVYLYNRWQERKFRRRAGEAFGEARGDALVGAGPADAAPAGRVEPQFGAPAPAPEVAGSGEPPAGNEPEDAGDSGIDYTVVVKAEAPVAIAGLQEAVLALTAPWGKAVVVSGYDETAGEWRETGVGNGQFRRWRCGLQLASRSGPVTAPQLAAFREAVNGWAAKHGASMRAAETEEALARAQALDRFCAEVDIAIGVNVVAGQNIVFPGARIRTLAEAAGFVLEPDGVFHLRDAARQTLFTLDNHEPMPFVPEQMGALQTRGLTLLLDVPRVSDAAAAFDRMLEVGRQLAQALGGVLVDDNRAPLSANGIATIRAQLAAIGDKFAARGILPGSPHALRLFA